VPISRARTQRPASPDIRQQQADTDMKFRLAIAGLAAGLFATLAMADTPPSHIRGTIAGLDGQTLTIATREGPKVSVMLPEKPRIAAMKKVDLSAIAPGTFIGTAAQPGKDGELEAIEVLVFPEASRGTGEGHYDWDLSPGTSMTNANVDAAVTSKDGRELTLSYKGGSVKVTVPPNVPVVTPIPADRSDLKAGAPVFIVALHNADGSLSAAFVAVGKDGVAPPM
jgi:hypothetical protein